MVFQVSSIIEITNEKIRFYDDKKFVQEIDLLECSKNWVDYYNSRDDFITWDGDPAPKTTIGENKCIGERDWFADKPYYEFYTSPKIRFEIHPKRRLTDHFNKNWKSSRYYEQFRKVSTDLEKVGWTTFDLG